MKREEVHKILEEAIKAMIKGDSKTLEETAKAMERGTVNTFKESIRKKGFEKTFKIAITETMKKDMPFLLEHGMHTLYKALKEIDEETKEK